MLLLLLADIAIATPVHPCGRAELATAFSALVRYCEAHPAEGSADGPQACPTVLGVRDGDMRYALSCERQGRRYTLFHVCWEWRFVLEHGRVKQFHGEYGSGIDCE